MRSTEVEQLISDLKEENPKSRIVSTPESQMAVIISDVRDRLIFTAEESHLLLANRSTVERLFEALDYPLPDDVFIELHGLTADSEIVTTLEEFAATVDEM